MDIVKLIPWLWMARKFMKTDILSSCVTKWSVTIFRGMSAQWGLVVWLTVVSLGRAEWCSTLCVLVSLLIILLRSGVLPYAGVSFVSLYERDVWRGLCWWWCPSLVLVRDPSGGVPPHWFHSYGGCISFDYLEDSYQVIKETSTSTCAKYIVLHFTDIIC